MNKKKVELSNDCFYEGDDKLTTYKNRIVGIVLSIISSWSLMTSLTTHDWPSVNNSIIGFIIFMFCIYVFNNFKLKPFRLSYIIIFLISLIYSISLVLGSNLILLDTSAIASFKTWLKIIGLLPFFIVLIFDLLMKRFTLHLENYELKNSFTEFFNRLSSFKRLLIIWGLIFLAWLPYWVVCYPGIFGYDAAIQINEFARGTITTHHPFLHTLLLGYFVKLPGGNFSESSVKLGIMMYSLLQMFCLSFSLACVENLVIKKQRFGLFSGLILLMMMFLPINPVMAISTTKNTFFTSFFILLFVMLYVFLEDKEVIDSTPFDLAYIVVSFLAMAFLNQMVYVFALSIIAITLICKKKKKFFAISLIAILLFEIWNGPITRIMGVTTDPNDRTRETMSLPIEQLSRTASFHYDSLSTANLKLIKKYIPAYKNYKKFPAVSDPIKNTFNAEYFRKDPQKFGQLWFSVGIKHPISYLDAFCKLTVSLWYPNFYKDPSIPEPYWEYNNIYTFNNLEKKHPQKQGLYIRKSMGVLAPLNEMMEKLTYQNTFVKVPLIPIMFSSGLPFWLILADVAIFAFKHNWYMFGALLLPLLLWCTLLLGPEVILRYTYPLICCEPILLLPIIRNCISN